MNREDTYRYLELKLEQLEEIIECGMSDSNDLLGGKIKLGHIIMVGKVADDIGGHINTMNVDDTYMPPLSYIVDQYNEIIAFMNKVYPNIMDDLHGGNG